MNKELTPLEAWEEVKDEMLEWTEGYEENFDVIETALKALDIFKTKQVDIVALRISKNIYEYNRIRFYGSNITKEEFNLLKKVLL